MFNLFLKSESQTHTEGEKDTQRESICWYTLQMAATVTALGQVKSVDITGQCGTREGFL